MSWLEQIRQMNQPRARKIRVLTAEEKQFLHETNCDQQRLREADRLDQELRRVWMLCVCLFTLLVLVTLSLLRRVT